MITLPPFKFLQGEPSASYANHTYALSVLYYDHLKNSNLPTNEDKFDKYSRYEFYLDYLRWVDQLVRTNNYEETFLQMGDNWIWDVHVGTYEGVRVTAEEFSDLFLKFSHDRYHIFNTHKYAKLSFVEYGIEILGERWINNP